MRDKAYFSSPGQRNDDDFFKLEILASGHYGRMQIRAKVEIRAEGYNAHRGVYSEEHGAL